MTSVRFPAVLGLACALGCVITRGAHPQGAVAVAEGTDPRARQMIEAAVQSELKAAEADHSVWSYRDHDKTTGKDAIYEVVDTPSGELRRMVELNGQPVDAATQQKETSRLSAFVHDSDAQAKQHKADQHDDAQANAMLKMLPTAYIWNIEKESPEFITLSFRPDPGFHPPDMEARVMGTMAGELTIARQDNRIRTLRGALTDDVKIGFGVLGKLRKGGTFDVERRELAPHIWQITETRVHIDGHALLFKTIGQQEDEIKTDWKPSTAPTLEAAAVQLGTH